MQAQKAEERRLQEFTQAKNDFINYMNTDDIDVLNEDSYLSRVDTTTTIEELAPIKADYEKAVQVVRDELEQEKATLLSSIEASDLLSEEQISQYTAQLDNVTTYNKYTPLKEEIETAKQAKLTELKEEAKQELAQLEYINTDEYLQDLDSKETSAELETLVSQAQADEAEEQARVEAERARQQALAEEQARQQSQQAVASSSSGSSHGILVGGSSSSSSSGAVSSGGSSSSSSSSSSGNGRTRGSLGGAAAVEANMTGDGGLNLR